MRIIIVILIAFSLFSSVTARTRGKANFSAFKKAFVGKTYKIISLGDLNGNEITVLQANLLNNRLITFRYRLNSGLLVSKGFFRKDTLTLNVQDDVLFVRATQGKIGSGFYIGFEKNGVDLTEANLVLQTR